MTESRDWDEEERDALAGVMAELDAVRRRHATDPSLELLSTARAGALPDPWQARVEAQLASSRWSRALVEGAELPDTPLDAVAAARILRRVRADSTAVPVRTNWRVTALLGGALAASLLAAVLGLATRPMPAPPPAIADARPAPQLSPDATPSFALVLDPADVRLSLGALTWRGDRPGGSFLTDLKPGLDAYRAGDYAAADRSFDTVLQRYPDAVEPHFYQGVSRLFLDNAEDAVTSLTTAARLAGDEFVDDVAWYLAIAYERTGQSTPAQQQLRTVCERHGARAVAACDAHARLDTAPSDHTVPR